MLQFLALMATIVFRRGIRAAYRKEISWQAGSGDTFRCALVLDAYTPDKDAHEFVSSIGSNRANSSGVDSTDQAVTPIDPDLSQAARIKFQVSESSILYTDVDTGQVVGGVVLFKFVTNDADSVLITANKFPATIDADDGDIEVTFAQDGFWRFLT